MYNTGYNVDLPFSATPCNTDYIEDLHTGYNVDFPFSATPCNTHYNEYLHISLIKLAVMWVPHFLQPL